MRFMMLMIPKGYEKAEPGTMPSAEAVCRNDEVQRRSAEGAGVLLSLDGLHTRVRWARASRSRRGSQEVIDGPFVETKEVLGGYWMIQVKSKDEAIKWASRCPVFGDDVIEIRQVQEMADFPADVQEAAVGFSEMPAQRRPS